jgi:Secretion system C-terminal sorting domain
MKKLLLIITVSISVIIFSTSFKVENPSNYHHFRSGGAALAFDNGYLGAPFAPGTCGGCHGGGSFAPTINVELLNTANIPVSSYIPEENYNLRISIVAGNGSPRFGFQTTCIQSVTEVNVNNWGASLPINVNNILVSGGRNYVEHAARLTSGIISIPWTAPAASFGAVKFFSIGNAVNSDFGTGGDNATNSFSLLINEGTLPVTLLSFNGKQTKDGVNLVWNTAQEINNAYFNVEHSVDGIGFKTIGKVIGSGNSNTAKSYSYNDKYALNGTNFYRLAQTDFDGRLKYSSVVFIQNKNTKTLVSLLPNPVVNSLKIKSNFSVVNNNYVIYNTTGTVVQNGILISQDINVEKLTSGHYFIRLQNKDGEIITEQFIK